MEAATYDSFVKNALSKECNVEEFFVGARIFLSQDSLADLLETESRYIAAIVYQFASEQQKLFLIMKHPKIKRQFEYYAPLLVYHIEKYHGVTKGPCIIQDTYNFARDYASLRFRDPWR